MAYKKIITCALAAVFFLGAAPPQQIAAMGKLQWLVGRWRGTGWVQDRTGRHTFAQHENVQSKLGDSLLLIEGNGTDLSTGAAKFAALGIVAIDERDGKYHFRAFNDGHYVDSEATVGTGSLQWGFAVPGATIRFTIVQKPTGHWSEIGERSTDGSSWQQFFAMDLSKIPPLSRKTVGS